MENILITGGAGYIGSHVVLKLIQNKFNPIVIDNLSRSNLQNIKKIEEFTNKKIEFHNFDLASDNILNFKKDVLAVIHLAAYKYVGESVKNPILYYKNNINSLINILEWINLNHVKSIVFSSSCSIFGTPLNDMGVTENSKINPESPYASTKAIGEEIINNFKNSYNLNSAILRYFNVAGNSTEPLIGDLDKNPQTLLPSLIKSYLGINNTKFTLFGNDYNTEDGTCIRDYIHVQDLADAHIKAVEYLTEKSESNVFNLGYGKGISVLSIIKRLEAISGKKFDYTITSRRQGDPSAIFSKSDKANSILNWKPSKSLDEMIQSTIEWYKSFLL